MYEYKFLAIVHPERVKFRLSLPSITLHFPELNLTGQFKIDSTDSHSTILFVTDINLLDHPSKDVLVSLKNILGNKARFFIDIFCYIHSYNYDLEVYRVVCDSLKIDITFDVQLELDLAIQPEADINAFLSKIVSLSFSDPRLYFISSVFGDFRRGIKYPESSGFYFYRSLDSIKKNLFGDDWNKMNKALGFTHDHYNDLNIYRRKNAHGVYPSITGAQRIKLAKDARKVIDAFLAYIEN